MKLTNEDHNVDMREDEEFYRRLGEMIDKFITYGMAASDIKGHGEVITFRIETSAFDILSIIKRSLPDRWTNKKMDLKRNIFTVGLIICQKYLEKCGFSGLENMERMAWKLETVNEIESIIRDGDLEERINQVKIMTQNMNSKSPHYNKVLRLLGKLDKKGSK